MDIIKMIHSDYVYSRGYRGKIKRVVLVFIFGFFSFSSFSVAAVAESDIHKAFKKRGLIISCRNAAELYSEDIASQDKFKALALREQGECAIIEGRIDEAKQKFQKSIDTFSKDFASMFLLLQLKFEESILINEDEPIIDIKLFIKLIGRISYDWPKSARGTDPYHYIQEVGSVLTPYTIALVYDYSNLITRGSSHAGDMHRMVEAIDDEENCVEILKKVRDKVNQYKIKTESKISKAISENAYNSYYEQSDLIKDFVCTKIDGIKQNFP